MSKYIVDIDDFEPHFKVDSIGVFGIGKSLSYSEEDHSWSRIKSIEEFEELNSDYINEHFGELQDEAYQRGLEDGKWKAENGCTGCKYEGNTGEHLPCEYCMNNFKNQWTAKQKDRIEVGDIVEVYGNLGVVTYMYELEACVMMIEDGSSGNWNLGELKKTGKHYDIASILEAMRE